MPSIQQINLSSLNVGAGTQIRVASDSNVVEEYARLMSEGVQFPPLVVMFDGAQYYLVDGFHRYLAKRKAHGVDAMVDVAVHTGTLRDAIKMALGANSTHGLPRSNEDKANAVKIALQEFPTLSAREIARIVRVSPGMVDRYRTMLDAKPEQVVGKDGKVQPTVKQVPKIGTSDELPPAVDLGETLPDQTNRVELSEGSAMSPEEALAANEAALAEAKAAGDTEKVASLEATHAVLTETIADEAEEAPEVVAEKTVVNAELDELEDATAVLHAAGKDIESLATLWTLISNLDKAITAKCRQDKGELLDAAKAINKSEGKPSAEAVAAVKNLASYWARFQAAIEKLG